MLKEKCTPQDFIMWNGVDMELYIRSMNPVHIPTILQFLQLFQWDKRAEKALRCLIRKHNLGVRIVATRQTEKDYRLSQEVVEPEPLRDIIGKCPLCGGTVKGGNVDTCEAKKSYRMYVKECDDCTYYSEVFWDHMKNIPVEIEGGE